MNYTQVSANESHNHVNGLPVLPSAHILDTEPQNFSENVITTQPLERPDEDVESTEEERQKRQQQEDCCCYMDPYYDSYDWLILCRCILWMCRSVGECTDRCCSNCADCLESCCESGCTCCDCEGDGGQAGNGESVDCCLSLCGDCDCDCDCASD